MKSFNRFIDDTTHDLLSAIHDGQQLADAMRKVTVRHAERLAESSEVAVLALDPCPRCGGVLLAGDTTVRCSAGCGFHFSERTPEPLASRRADA